MPRRVRELVADWLLLGGAAVLFASLFLNWSHQYPRSVLAVPGLGAALAAVPRDATAWQVYSAADVLLAALAAALVASALIGSGRWLVFVSVPAAGALAFTIHALSVPPTSGAEVVIPGSARAVRSLATTGAGETVAVIGLTLALVGLALCLSSNRGHHAR